jgi:hypothetical protein
VRFDCGEYSEQEEEQKLIDNKKKFKKPQNDVKIMLALKRFVKEVTIKGNDPLLTLPYNQFYLLDRIE